MKISLEWLSDFVTWVEKDPRAIADRITLGSAEVEEVEMQGAQLEGCVVGEIVSVKKHPDADRLSIAEVKTDKGTKTVVCGGTNVRQGMQVAFAHIGSTVKWHGGNQMTLQPVKIRGVASEGMICAGEELGIESLFPPSKEDGERPIVDLSDRKFKTGTPLRDALGLKDTVLHINNTAITTRPDLFSHLGFARECVALGIAKWKKKPVYKLPTFPSSALPFKMKVDADDQVSRYCSCLLTIDGLGQTPDWMKRRLEATGWRSVNLPVDITNYVTMETGMPLHSFDADDIKGDVHLRLSKKGEKITTLDGIDRPLPDGALVLSDDKGIFDLLGIMGGQRSSTKPMTKRIYLHAAALDPVTIRKTIMATGHRTEASTVYEKGVPPITAEVGFIRAVELFRELVPKCAAASTLDSWGKNGTPKSLTLSVPDVQTILGVTISAAEITRILTAIECTVKKGKKDTLTVVPPLHRLRDLSGVHDIIDEIGRFHGYDRIPEAVPMAEVRIPARDKRLHTMRDGLKASGHFETVPLSFISAALLEKSGLSAADAIAILNPLGEETALLQLHTYPQLLEHASRNIAKVHGALKTFRTGNVFAKGKPEQFELSTLHAATHETGLLDDPFLHAKEDILHAAEEAGYELSVEPMDKARPAMHPGRAAMVKNGQDIVGVVFEVHPTVRARFDLPHRAAVGALNLTVLFAKKPATRMAKPLPLFPSVTYDETIPRKHADQLGPLLDKLKKGATLLEHVTVHDLYAGKNVKPGEFSATLRFVYRAPDRTLTEEEAKKAHGEVMKAIV